MDSYIPLPVRKRNKPFRFYVDKHMQVRGHGLIVMGYLEQGLLEKGTKALLLGKKLSKKVTILSIEKFHKPLLQAEPGDRLGLKIKGVLSDSIQRGMVICSESSQMRPYQRGRAKIYLRSGKEGGRASAISLGFEPIMYIELMIIPARIIEIASNAEISGGEEKMMMPGESGEVLFDFNNKFPVDSGARFTLREANRTIGHGVFTQMVESKL